MTTTSMEDLYPGGVGYHDAHGPYIQAVAQALDDAGLAVADWHADPNDPRDGAIQLDMNKQGTIDGHPLWPYDEVWVGWQEERGWHLLAINHKDGAEDSRYAHNLHLGLVPNPASVVNVVGDKAGLALRIPDDGYPYGDFPGHTFEDDNPEFEMALRVYREG